MSKKMRRTLPAVGSVIMFLAIIAVIVFFFGENYKKEVSAQEKQIIATQFLKSTQPDLVLKQYTDKKSRECFYYGTASTNQEELVGGVTICVDKYGTAYEVLSNGTEKRIHAHTTNMQMNGN